MKKGVVLAALVVAGGCGPILGPGSLEDKLAVAEDYVNRHGTDQMRKQIGPQFGSAKVSSRVDGNDTLVIVIKDLPTGKASWDPFVMRKTLRGDMCAQAVYRELFEAGGKAKLEVTSNIGFQLPSVQVAGC